MTRLVDTGCGYRYSLEVMFGRRIFGIAIAGVLVLLLGEPDCRIWAAANAQAMECCARMGCTSGQRQRTCFAATAPADGSRTIPPARASLAVPSLTTALQPRTAEPDLRGFQFSERCRSSPTFTSRALPPASVLADIVLRAVLAQSGRTPSVCLAFFELWRQA